MLPVAATMRLFGGGVQVSRMNVVTSAAPSAPSSSADKINPPTKSAGGMTTVSEMSRADTRHSLGLIRLPADSLASPGILLIVTDAPGTGSSTMTPSATGSLMRPLTSWTISVGAALRCGDGNHEAFNDCQVGKPANTLSSIGPRDVGKATTNTSAARIATDTATASLAMMPSDARS